MTSFGRRCNSALVALVLLCYVSVQCPQMVDTTEHAVIAVYDVLMRGYIVKRPPDVFEVFFYFYGRNNPLIYQQLRTNDDIALQNSNFNPRLPTKIVIHGMLDGVFITQWQMKLKDAFLRKGDYNVILVDWSLGSQPPPARVVVNSPIATLQTVNFLRYLMDRTGWDIRLLHCLGHSQGAQICGLIGQEIRGIPRISGMDPSGDFIQRLSRDVTLSRDDAIFIDVIQTNAAPIIFKGFGALVKFGDYQFVTNGGKFQPGCDVLGALIATQRFTPSEAIRRLAACHHYRSIDLYTEFINYDKCVPVAYACRDYETFLKGECADCNDGKDCAIVGLRANEFVRYVKPSKREFFYKTASQPPFCLFHYQLLVSIDNNRINSEEGLLRIVFPNYHQHMALMPIRTVPFTFGFNGTMLMTTSEEIRMTDLIEVSWVAYNFQTLHIRYIRLLPMNYIDSRVRKDRTQYFCTGIPGTPQVFYPMQTLPFYADSKCDLKEYSRYF